ncbi:hypothetical protein JOC37_000907 [Desulfohalotomaculum tongense]|uniref:DUF4321 domain-containing protein n=1 Tax=Desulforadius tongensis TaxID=1216062 RepID=UPI00195EDED3|nr:DUF4321 domain-containing protein [Desulforadius tongensis]MBM7854534.1 hypothetical protein [Desulforadius tongensis]
MARVLGGARSAWLLFLLLLAGGVAGSAVGAALSPMFPVLRNFFNIGLATTSLNLNFFSVSFGFHLAVGPFTALGLFLGYIAYRKL